MPTSRPAIRLAFVFTSFFALVVSGFVGLVGLVACGGVSDRELASSELGDRLLAPCCWRDPLRAHPSPLADQLRAEIQARLAAGETAAQIEDDLVRRYSERIRALPAGGDPRWMILAFSAALAGVGLFALFRVVKPRLARSSHATHVTPVPPTTGAPAQTAQARPEDDDYRLRLDEELAAVD